MAVTQTITQIPQVPLRSETVDELEYRNKVEAFLLHIKQLATELETARGQINSTETNINNKEDSTVSSANTATTKANEASSSASAALTAEAKAIEASYLALQYKNAIEANNLSWDIISGKPAEFTPSSHGHTLSSIVDFPSAVSATELGYLEGVTSSIQTQINAKASLVSPALAGNPTAPTPTSGDNSTKIATTAFVAGSIGKISSVPTNSQTFTASGTFIVPTGVTRVLVTGCGGGGGGGGADNDQNGPIGGGGGGSGGIPTIVSVTPGSSITVTIGAGGAGGSGGSGGTGGTGGASTFGSLVTFHGGLGGVGAGGSGGVDSDSGIGVGGRGAGVGGDGGTPYFLTTSIAGYKLEAGRSPHYLGGTTANISGSGGGGAGLYGNGANGITTAGNGVSAAANTGAGGSGAIGSSTVTGNGGVGGSGKIVVYW